MTEQPIEIVERYFDAYLQQDRETAESLTGADFVFTSPQDDHIDRAAYFERCFPTADRFASQQLLVVVNANDEDVAVVYEYELDGGAVHRNAELLTVRDGQVHEIEVYFGGKF